MPLKALVVFPLDATKGIVCAYKPRVPLPFSHLAFSARKPLPAAYPRGLSTLGDHLRKRRLDLGLLQREVADKLGVDEMTTCNWEINRTSP
jgi:hypothetical protein